MPVSFTKVKLPFGWLGNMAGFKLEYGGKEWRTSEALFQALRFADEAIREEIRLAISPMTAKMIAKKHADKMAITPMSAGDVAIMELVLRLKLDQHPHLKAELLATGDEVIIEDVTNRPSGGRHIFWGMSKASGEWVGDNTLGKLWMKIRKELQDGIRSDTGSSAGAV
jgi:ribA/ribD-fused uncharacterized protein